MKKLAVHRQVGVFIALLALVWPATAAAQAAQGPDRPVRVGSYLGASPWVISFGLDASVSLMPALDLVGMLEAWIDHYRGPFPGPVPEWIPDQPRTPTGVSAGGGLRLAVRDHPRTHVTVSAGLHEYTTGSVAERAPLLGLGIGQSWVLNEHLDIGWALTGRRVSGYDKLRYRPDIDVTGRTFHDAEYLGVLAFTLGGLF